MKRPSPMTHVEVCGSFMHVDHVLYRRGDVVALESGNAEELRVLGFVKPTEREPNREPPRRGTYGRRDMRAEK